ncbi:unnamed protein product, partial [Prunus brigantina]
ARRCTCTSGRRKSPLEVLELHLCFRPATHIRCSMKCARDSLRCLPAAVRAARMFFFNQELRIRVFGFRQELRMNWVYLEMP